MSAHNIFIRVNNNEFRVYNPYIKQFSTLNYSEFNKLPKKFEVLKGYDSEDIDLSLIRYYKDFVIFNRELKESEYNGYFNYYYSNNMAVYQTFTNYSTHNFNNDSIINEVEANCFEKCNNGGLIYCQEGINYCNGYDFNSFYPRLLGSSEYNLKIPIGEGREYLLQELNFNDIKFGFYNVIIECSDELFLKIFSFSCDNIYTHYSLLFAIQHQQEFNITIELIKDISYNAYLYNNDVIMNTNTIFNNWFNVLISSKTQYPKNKLIKHLLSSLWGQLCERQKEYVTDDKLINYDWGLKSEGCEYFIESINDNIDNAYNILINRNKLYKHNIRLKPFLLSYSRNIIGTIAYENNLNDVIRVFCDNITYKNNYILDVPYMSVEDKTTGLINFKNSCNYYKVFS